ncbi:metal-sensing transcriptional repressor [Blautia sp. RD014234]|nr:metal-sensing transcriptional repressor [Blautia parvula]
MRKELCDERREKDTGTKYDKSMVNRLARATGHLKSIRGMVEEGRDCSEVLIQLAAVRSAVNGAGKEVLKQYMDECIEEALEKGDTESLKRLNKALDSFLK